MKVENFDNLWVGLPRPPFSEAETEMGANRVYDYVWQRSAGGPGMLAASA